MAERFRISKKVFLDYRKPAPDEKKRCHLCVSFVQSAEVSGRGGIKGYEPRCVEIGFEDCKEQRINANHCCRLFKLKQGKKL